MRKQAVSQKAERETLIDMETRISDLCVEIGGMVGYTVYSDICEGLEVKP